MQCCKIVQKAWNCWKTFLWNTIAFRVCNELGNVVFRYSAAVNFSQMRWRLYSCRHFKLTNTSLLYLELYSVIVSKPLNQRSEILRKNFKQNQCCDSNRYKFVNFSLKFLRWKCVASEAFETRCVLQLLRSCRHAWFEFHFTITLANWKHALPCTIMILITTNQREISSEA